MRRIAGSERIHPFTHGATYALARKRPSIIALRRPWIRPAKGNDVSIVGGKKKKRSRASAGGASYRVYGMQEAALSHSLRDGSTADTAPWSARNRRA